MSLSLRTAFTLLPLGMIFGGLMFAVFWSKQPERFPIRVIELKETLNYLTPLEVEQTLVPHLNNGFFWIDVEALQKKLLALPWTFKASIKRRWPDKLIVSLQEHSPIARFNKEAVLSQEGVLFYPSPETLASLSSDLPQFWGSDEHSKELFEHYGTFVEMLTPLDLEIKELSSSNEGMKMLLNNGIKIILGKETSIDRMGRFALAYLKGIKEKVASIAYLDLRYSNGLAIGWKTEVK